MDLTLCSLVLVIFARSALPSLHVTRHDLQSPLPRVIPGLGVDSVMRVTCMLLPGSLLPLVTCRKVGVTLVTSACLLLPVRCIPYFLVSPSLTSASVTHAKRWDKPNVSTVHYQLISSGTFWFDSLLSALPWLSYASITPPLSLFIILWNAVSF